MPRHKRSAKRERARAPARKTRPPRGRALSAPVLLIAIGGALLLAFQLFGHGTPLYGAETDLLGDIIPAARSLCAGHIVAAHFEFKGPGYPLMLAAAGSLVGNDWLAARLLNVVSAVLGAWLSYRVATRFLSPGASL